MVRLHPDDHAALAGHALDDARPITLVADTGLAPGDAVATSGATQIDGRIHAGLERIKDALRQ
jgi:flagellar biosynthesis/type III secretory pathway protein FliH